MHKYNDEATEKLRDLPLKIAPLVEYIKLVDRKEGADPNVRVGLNTLLEEAILHRSSKAVLEILLKNGRN